MEERYNRKYNFYSGPATLPAEVLEEARNELLNYRGIGMSLVETSHRSAEYREVHDGVRTGLARLLGLSEDFEVLLLGGGASLQFSMLPLNVLSPAHADVDVNAKRADFVHSGAWSAKALADSAKYGQTRVLWNYAERGCLPGKEDFAQLAADSAGSAYLHITSNETIDGIQWQELPANWQALARGAASAKARVAPLVADMSSDILSRRIPVESFSLIYAGAQKNLGPSGVTIVIIRKDLLERCPDPKAAGGSAAGAGTGAYLNYRSHAAADSLYNTPPVFSVWLVGKVLSWIQARGGLNAVEHMNAEKAALLYETIDESEGFYNCPVAPAYRSRMNVVFTLQDSELESAFLAGAAERGMVGLKGHRSVGGCRASLYNAMPRAGVDCLTDYMRDFARRRG